MKIGFIGCGNMNTAIIKGYINADKNNYKNVYAFNPSNEKIDRLVKEYGINKCSTSSEVVNLCDYIFFGVKPNVLETVLKETSDEITNNKVIISIAAGKTINFIENCLKNKAKIIRVMPNINAVVGESCTAVCNNENVLETESNTVIEIFNKLGKTYKLEEKMFPLFGVLAGCTPAFAFMFIDELARAAVENGMKKDLALEIATQTVLGSTKTIEQSDKHPYKLIDEVCSPGGTTIEGVLSLQKNGFENSIHDAINAAIDKDSKL